MGQSADGDLVSREAEVQAEQVRAAFQQIPVAALVTAANASLMAGVLLAAGQGRGAYAWLALSILVAAARLAVWRAYRHAAPAPAQYRRWALASTCGAFAAGLLWGGGSFLLFPEGEIYQLFWVFLIAGMCAGAVALHYAHLPSALAFIFPAGLPLAIRFALEGGERRAAAAAMIGVFLVALVVTVRRSSRYFGEVLQLRIDLAERTRELDASNALLRREIAERQATQARLHHAQKMEAVGQLTGGVAHDFNNLLTVILGSLALLERRVACDERARSLLETARKAVGRGAQLCQSLLAFSRRQPLRLEPVDANALLQESATLIRRALGETVRLELGFEPGLPACRADAAQLQAAVLNLVINARDAMPQGGTLSVRTAKATLGAADLAGNEDAVPGGFVALSVRDTGHGMPPEVLARAFEPFFTTKEVGKGTGLGLSQVYGFVRQLSGHVSIDSAPGHGTTVTLYLPVAERAAAPSAEAATPPAEVVTVAAATVLLVEDEAPVLEATAEVLREAGWRVLTARDAREALQVVEGGEAVDVLFTDVVMPGGMTGIDLARAARRLRPGLGVLLTSGYAGAALGPDAGGFAVVVKPYESAELLARLAAMVPPRGLAATDAV